MQVKTPSHLSLSNMEVLVAVIDDGTVLAAGSDVANTLCVGEHDNQQTANRLFFVINTCSTDAVGKPQRCTSVFTYLCGCSQFHSLLCRHTITGIENGRCGKGPEHSHVLQTHQGGAFLSCNTFIVVFIQSTLIKSSKRIDRSGELMHADPRTYSEI